MTLSMNDNSGPMTWRSRAAVAVGLCLTVAAAACSGGASTVTSPSGVAPSSAGTNVGTCQSDTGGNQAFSVSISPATVTVGASQLTVTVTNDLQSNCNQELGSAQIVAPSGLTVTGVGSITQAQGKDWATTWTSGQTVVVGARSKPGGGAGSGAGLQKLTEGESVTFTIDVMSSVCGINTFDTPTAWAETLDVAKVDTFPYVGGELSVTVEGCTACTDPEAPSISHAYFTGELGLAANDPRHNDVQNSVAHEQAADKTFHGISPCDHPAFENAVKAYVDGLLSGAIPYYHS